MATKDITDLQVVKAYQDSKVAHCDQWPYDLLEQRTGRSIKECYSAMERAYRRGFIECGVSLRSGWLTAKGIDLYNGVTP